MPAASLSISFSSTSVPTCSKAPVAETHASVIAIILVNPPAKAVACVTASAAKVATALRAMTSLQREAMLADPLIALASNIAFDCEAEFDNEEALARWSKAAALIGQS